MEVDDDPTPQTCLSSSESVTERPRESAFKMQRTLASAGEQRGVDPLRIEVIIAGLSGSSDSPALFMADMRGAGNRNLGVWFSALRFSALRRIDLGLAAEFPGSVRSPFPPRYLFRDFKTNARNISERAELLSRYCTSVVDAVKAGRLPLAVLQRFAAVARHLQTVRCRPAS